MVRVAYLKNIVPLIFQWHLCDSNHENGKPLNDGTSSTDISKEAKLYDPRYNSLLIFLNWNICIGSARIIRKNFKIFSTSLALMKRWKQKYKYVAVMYIPTYIPTLQACTFMFIRNQPYTHSHTIKTLTQQIYY